MAHVKPSANLPWTCSLNALWRGCVAARESCVRTSSLLRAPAAAAQLLGPSSAWVAAIEGGCRCVGLAVALPQARVCLRVPELRFLWQVLLFFELLPLLLVQTQSTLHQSLVQDFPSYLSSAVFFGSGEPPSCNFLSLHFSICVCHPCARAMLFFSVSFQFKRNPM